jgi:4-amino-4-deoxy-L-arabinose transferase-like glycosyltransferase
MQNTRGQKVFIGALVIFILAFALRILHIVSIYKTSPFFDILPGDLGAYDRWAKRIVEEGWLGTEIFYQDPLYPYFLAFFYKTIGRDFFWIYMVQAFLGAASSLLLVVLGTRVFNRATGLYAGLLYGLYGPAIYFDGLLLKVTLSAFLFILAIYLLLRKDFKDVGPSQFFSGFFLGLACLTRANFLLILPVVFFTLLLNKNAWLKKRLGMALLFFIGVLTALGPVVARNYAVGNELVLTTSQAGQNFYIGHNPDANGTYIKLSFVRPDPLYEQKDFKKEAEKRTGRKLTSSEASGYWMQQGLAFTQDNPLADLQLTGKKLLLFLNNYEIADNLNYYFHQRYSYILQNLPIGFGLLAPFFLLGLLAMFFQRRTAPVFISLVQVVYIVSVIIFFVFSRYRMVALPLFCLSAGYGLSLLQSHFRMAQWRKLAADLAVVGCTFAVTYYPVIEPFDFSHSFTDEGLAYEMHDEPEKARHSYEMALEINPHYFRALDRLGKVQLQQKEYEGARSTYRKILALDPDSVDAKYQIMFLDTLGLGPEGVDK